MLLYSGKFNKDVNDIFSSLKNHNDGASSFCTNEQGNNLHHTKQNMHNNKQSTMSMHNNKSSSTCHGSKNSHSSHKMSSMHYSDVTYSKHMINESYNVLNLANRSNGKEVKLRIVNTYIDGFLNFVYSGGDIKVVASDGLPVKPFTIKNLKVAMGETYDIILKTKEGKSYEIVSFMLGTKDYSKVIIGKGSLVSLSDYNYKNYSLRKTL